MSSTHQLLRNFGQLTCKSLKIPNIIPLKRSYGVSFSNGKDHTGKTNPECNKVECDPKMEPFDKNLALLTKPTEIKKDQPGSYRSCPPPIQKSVMRCEDLPQEPQAPRRKRKPFVPAAACKKPAVTVCVPPCEKVKEEKCRLKSMPDCPNARVPPKCPILNKRPDCKRQEYKFPAFSACFKLPQKTRVDECGCLDEARVCN